MMKNKLCEKLNIGFVAITAAALIAVGATDVCYAHATEDTGLEGTGEDSGRQEKVQAIMSESYNSDYDEYEESMDDLFFFHTNVGNGGYADKPVYFDFPKNLSYSFEKDGESYSYAGADITAEGNYVVRLEGEYEGVTYTGTFRFSVREIAEETQEDNTGEDGEGNNDISDMTGEELMNLSDEELMNLDLNDLGLDEEISDEEIQAMIEEQGMAFGASNGGVDLTDPSFAIYKMKQTFNEENGYYNYQLLTGEEFSSNVPNGAIVNVPVVVKLADNSNLNISVYRDGELLEMDQIMKTYNFSDNGFYQVIISSKDVDFGIKYPDTEGYPYITFRVVTKPVSSMEVFNAPKGFKIVYAEVDRNIVRNEEGGDVISRDYFYMEEDGTYFFEVQDQTTGLSYEVTVTKDTVRPDFYVNIAKGTAVPTYNSPDIARVDIYKNNYPMTNPDISRITGKGNYVMYVYDEAGNYSSTEFHLDSYFAGSNILAILAIILGAGGLFVFIRLQRTTFKIR